jgi:hypothetical protein
MDSASPAIHARAMTSIEVRVPHALGRAEALRRIRAKAEPMIASGRAPITSLEWTDEGARIASANSSGTLACTDTEVVVNAELGGFAAFMSAGAKKAVEGWLREVLA